MESYWQQQPKFVPQGKQKCMAMAATRYGDLGGSSVLWLLSRAAAVPNYEPAESICCIPFNFYKVAYLRNMP
ncbi:hypothetical protein COLO4_31905 [Corchorus olitorius]|uniref:Uncharacterized protein n=1 Tax=Corchorus olitorius TaxID=93759 RepID=A0A1R3H309_9ROSI|nr:hypothetical protein COLO4_31905 [Corchorus olitorius]